MAFSIEEMMTLMEAGEDDNNTAPNNNQGNQGNDDFSIDTTLDDDAQENEDSGEGNPDENGEDQGNAENGEGGEGESEGSPEPSEEDIPDEEPNEDNTELFLSLSKEEQTMKIKILKQQYAQLYASCDELIDRIDDLDTDESNVITINRLSESIYNLKKYLSDYLIHLFASKSFVENDIMFNRFLDIINTITVSFDKICKEMRRKEAEEAKKESSRAS